MYQERMAGDLKAKIMSCRRSFQFHPRLMILISISSNGNEEVLDDLETKKVPSLLQYNGASGLVCVHVQCMICIKQTTPFSVPSAVHHTSIVNTRKDMDRLPDDAIKNIGQYAGVLQAVRRIFILHKLANE